MYYRGANAALLLYDITNAATFDDVRGWLEGKFPFLLLSSFTHHLNSEMPNDAFLRLCCAFLQHRTEEELLI